MIDEAGNVVVSASTLKDVAMCTTADVMRHALKWTGRDTTGARTLGQVWHEVMELYFKYFMADEALEYFGRKWGPISLELCGPVEKKRDGKTYLDPNPRRLLNVAVILEEWLKAHPREALPYQVVATELPFKLPLTPLRFFYRGRIDALVVKDDKFWVLDFKTTSRLDENFWKQFRMDAALTGYVWAAERITNNPIAGVIIEGVEIKEIPSSTRKCSDHGVAYAECGRFHVSWGYREFERSRLDLQDWAINACMLTTRHDNNMDRDGFVNDKLDITFTPQEGKFQGACYKYEGFAKCDFAEFCEAGRPIDNAEVYGLTRVEDH